MYNEKRNLLFDKYTTGKSFFVSQPDTLIRIERYVSDIINTTIVDNFTELEHDYNEASYLNPFWANYPPEERGRAPVGDQVPWIEVGEHAIGHKLNRIIAQDYTVSEVGLPSGADNRFVLRSDEISNITKGLTDSAFVFLDIKSVGPRDDFDHTVISPYQVSGDGLWNAPSENMENSTMLASGQRATHTFYPAIAPIYVLTDGTIAPTIHLFVKPVYTMLSMNPGGKIGQPLNYIKSICVPNGLLLTINPNYLKTYPSLFFPGKDDKKKDPKKVRVRVSFSLLDIIDGWRVQEFTK